MNLGCKIIKNSYDHIMKHNDLRSIAHNIADSFASGMGFLIGVYGIDIFGEAQKSLEGYITVDFLNGTTTGGTPSQSLAKAIKLYSEALPDLCEKQGSTVSSFRSLTARYSLTNHVVVTVEDEKGRQSTDEYVGIPLQRVKTTDGLGRIRTKRK